MTDSLNTDSRFSIRLFGVYTLGDGGRICVGQHRDGEDVRQEDLAGVPSLEARHDVRACYLMEPAPQAGPVEKTFSARVTAALYAGNSSVDLLADADARMRLVRLASAWFDRTMRKWGNTPVACASAAPPERLWFPVRKDAEILPADEPGRLLLGWYSVMDKYGNVVLIRPFRPRWLFWLYRLSWRVRVRLFPRKPMVFCNPRGVTKTTYEGGGKEGKKWTTLDKTR